jgi:hypothetical protein
MNRYQNIPTIIIDKKPVYRTVKYPEIPLDENDIYVTTVQGDRFDVLALQYYQDESLWWVISTANDSLPQNSLIIPENVSIIIQNYNILNS